MTSRERTRRRAGTSKAGKAIRNWREVRGWNQIRAALFLGISQSLLSLLETGAKRSVCDETRDRLRAGTGLALPDRWWRLTVHA